VGRSKSSLCWEEVKAVYVDDKLNLELDKFLSQGHQVHVQTNILAVMLVAIEKDFWKADDKTKKELANKFANNIIKNGIPGSGHTHANHPMYDFVKLQIDKDLAKKLETVLEESRMKINTPTNIVSSIKEISLENQNLEKEDKSENKKNENENKNENNTQDNNPYLKYLIGLAILLLLFGLGKSVIVNKIKGQ